MNTPSSGPFVDSPYRIKFVGGPFDGAIAPSKTAPYKSLDLPASSAERDPLFGWTIVDRAANYRWTSTRLSVLEELPVLLFNYQYSGSVLIATHQPTWRRVLQALRRWWNGANHAATDLNSTTIVRRKEINCVQN
jgi:hypothetical protein